MKRITALIVCLAMLLLVSCSKSKPIVSSTPASTVATDASTTTAGGANDIAGFSTTDATATDATPTPLPGITYTVQRATLEDLLTFTAKVAPAQSALSFSQDGVVKSVFVKPGQMITEGDLVAQLDLADLETQLSNAQLTVQQSQRAIDQATQIGQLDVQQAQMNLDAAQNDLARTKAPPSAIILAQARANIRQSQANLDTVRNNASQAKNQAKANMEKAVSDLQSIQKDYGETAARLKKAKGKDIQTFQDKLKLLDTQMRAAEAAIETASITYDTARNNEAAAVSDAESKLDLAKAQLDDLLKGPDKFVIADKERAVRAAEIAVAQTRQRTTTDPALLKAVESGKLQITQVQGQITARQLVSPMSGEVSAINLPPGSASMAGNPVVTLIDRSRLSLIANQAAILASGRSGIPQLNTNQVITITSSRYKDRTFSGTISKVPVIPTDGTVATDTTYAFAFDAQGLIFDPGDQTEITIVLGRKTNTLYLPPAAIRTVRDRSTVTMHVGDKDKSVDVVIGIVTPDKIEIISGLKEGDVVLAAK